MSHVACVELVINDLIAIKATCKRNGWIFHENKKNYNWFGRWVNDYHGQDAAYNQGVDPNEYGKCEHCIEIPGIHYQIGLVKKPKGKTGEYVAIFDFYGTDLKQALGGQYAPKLMQTYGVEKVRAECLHKGYKVTEKKTKTGDIQLVIAGKF